MYEGHNGYDYDDTTPAEVNLPEIIEDRKAERKTKAEQNRQVNLQRFKDMNSIKGSDPLLLFPKVVWEKILDELDPEDRKNIWQVHPLFRDLMASTQVRDILLPLVMKVDEFRRCIKKIAPANSFHFGRKMHPKSLYGTLRRVSKSMKKSIDCWVEDDIANKIAGMEDREDDISSIDYPGFSMHEEKMKRLNRLIDGFTGENPALSFFPKGIEVFVMTRCLQIDDAENEEQVREHNMHLGFVNRITALLKIIGPQLWRFTFYISPLGERDSDSDEIRLSEAYIVLQRWTSLTPNLKWLKVELDLDDFPSSKVVHFPISVVKEHPFPRLAALERVRFHHGGGDPELATPGLFKIHEAILMANRHVSKLNFSEVSDPQFGLLNTNVVKYLPLTSFSVVHRNWNIADNLRVSLARSMINTEWKLKTIELDLFNPAVSMYDMLQVLNKFPTLEKVALKFEAGVDIGIDDLGMFQYLKLPNLSDFELKITHPEIDYHCSNIHFLFSLQFLIFCTKLRTLRWTIHKFNDSELRRYLIKHERQSKGNMLNFRTGLRILSDSNIWDVFPELETVYVEGVKETSDYELACKHLYRRPVVGEVVSLNRFLKNHTCSCGEHLDDCVMLFA